MIEKTLPKIDIFAGLAREQITELCGWLKPYQYAAGSEIFRENQLPNGLYILTNGTVGVMKSSAHGKFKLASIEAPDFFGEMGLLEGAERSAGVIAKTDVMVSLLPADLFIAKLQANNMTALRIALNVGRLVCRRLRDTNKKLANLTSSVATRRPHQMARR